MDMVPLGRLPGIDRKTAFRRARRLGIVPVVARADTSGTNNCALVTRSDAERILAAGAAISTGTAPPAPGPRVLDGDTGPQETIADLLSALAGTAPPARARAERPSQAPLAVLCLGDWHIGAPCSGSVEERAAGIPDAVASALDGRGCRSIVVACLGDLVDGEGIYPGQAVALSSGALDQCRLAAEAAWRVVSGVSTIAPTTVYGVRGNHGRTSKDDPARSASANWDSVALSMLGLMSRTAGGPHVVVSDDEWLIVEEGGLRGMIRHKAPPQADTAAGAARFAGWLAIHRFDWMAYGHCHHWGVHEYAGRPIVRNGALCDTNDYAEGLGRVSRPTQAIFGLDERGAVTFVTPLSW